jgi:hypothetical protein
MVFEAASLIFSDGQGWQTSDLRRERDGFFMNGQWYDQQPDRLSRFCRMALTDDPPVAHASLQTATIPPAREPIDPHGPIGRFPRGNHLFPADRPLLRRRSQHQLLLPRPHQVQPSTGQPEDPHWRGDFKGLIQRLDYIRDLGFTAIWITPPVENRSGLDYHGYHAYDWTRIDPRLESPDATYQDLIDEAHQRGIKIIQDVVVNHSCQYGIRGKVHIDHLPIKYYVPQGSEPGRVNHGPYQGNLGNYAWPNRDDIDNPVAPDWYRERHNMDPEGKIPLVDPKTGETVPKPGYNPGRFFGIDAQTLDPEWYMQHGFHLRRRLGKRRGAVEAYRRRLHQPGDRPAEREGLSDRLHQPLSRHGRGRAAHRHGKACAAR